MTSITKDLADVVVTAFDAGYQAGLKAARTSVDKTIREHKPDQAMLKLQAQRLIEATFTEPNGETIQ